MSESDFSRTSRTGQPSECPVRLVSAGPGISDKSDKSRTVSDMSDMLDNSRTLDKSGKESCTGKEMGNVHIFVNPSECPSRTTVQNSSDLPPK